MNQFRSLPLLASLLLGACASQAPKSAPPSGGTAIAPATEAPVRDDAGVTAQPAAAGMAAPDAVPASAAAPADSQAAAGTGTAAAGAPTDAESDFDALYCPTTPQAGAN
ncbi:lipoprotein, partial [Xanthomonas perforans]